MSQNFRLMRRKRPSGPTYAIPTAAWSNMARARSSLLARSHSASSVRWRSVMSCENTTTLRFCPAAAGTG